MLGTKKLELWKFDFTVSEFFDFLHQHEDKLEAAGRALGVTGAAVKKRKNLLLQNQPIINKGQDKTMYKIHNPYTYNNIIIEDPTGKKQNIPTMLLNGSAALYHSKSYSVGNGPARNAWFVEFGIAGPNGIPSWEISKKDCMLFHRQTGVPIKHSV